MAFAECVVKGAALLDEKSPGWALKINLESLDMSRGWLCVLGQVFGGDIKKGELALFGMNYRDNIARVTELEIEHGFWALLGKDYAKNMATLRDLWAEEVRSRT